MQVAYVSLKEDVDNYLKSVGLCFEYDLPQGYLIQELFKKVLSDIAQERYSLPEVRRFGDTSSSPLTHIKLLRTVNKGKPNRRLQIKVEPFTTSMPFTIDALVADRNRFAGNTCIDSLANPPRLIVRISAFFL